MTWLDRRLSAGVLASAIVLTAALPSSAQPTSPAPSSSAVARPAGSAASSVPSSSAVAPPAGSVAAPAASSAVAPPAGSAVAPPGGSAVAPPAGSAVPPAGSAVPPAPGAPTGSSPPKTPPPVVKDEPCDDAVRAWATKASARVGVALTPIACGAGIARFKVEGSECDFEVARDRGFQRTADGKLGVSPIVDMDWNNAPPGMRRGLDSLLKALAEDPSLPLPTGEIQRRFKPPVEVAKEAEAKASRDRMKIAAGVGGAAVLAGLLFLVLRRRRAG